MSDPFDIAASALLKRAWHRRTNIMSPGRPASYPARLTRFLRVKVDGRKKVFQITFSEFRVRKVKVR